MENAVKMSLLIDETAKTDAGFEIIKTIAKNSDSGGGCHILIDNPIISVFM